MPTASISEIYDLSTSVGRGTVLKIHTPTGNNIKRHLMGHFLQYKQFKYLGADVSLIPASTLPADPLSLGYDEGEPTIDPRDMVNPILYRYYHGEAMLTDALIREFPDAYGSGTDAINTGRTLEHVGHSVDQQGYLNGLTDSEYDMIYPNCLMDPSFKKAGVQQGFRIRVKPYVYNLVSNRQYLSNSRWSFPAGTGSDSAAFFKDASRTANWQSDKGIGSYVAVAAIDEGDTLGAVNMDQAFVGELFTNKLQPLGWMDTVTNVWNADASNINNPAPANVRYSPDNAFVSQSGIGSSGSFAYQTYLPNISMLYVMMPPAYKTLFYFRLMIKHHFAFRGFRSTFNIQSYGSASIRPDMPLPYVAPISASSLAQGLSDMISEVGTGGPDSVVVENGEIVSAADGVGV